MSSDLWANVASGAVGGVLALGGSWFTHFLTDRKEARIREEERSLANAERLRQLYVDWLAELHEQMAAIIEATQGPNDPKAIKDTIRDAHLRKSSKTAVTLRMLEPNLDARIEIEKAETPTYNLIRLYVQKVESLVSTGRLEELLMPAIDAIEDAERWLYSVRFPPKK